MYRRGSVGGSSAADIEVLLAHPGGPFWQNKDHGAWTIPKGEHDEGEDPLSAARREFEEETGCRSPADGPYVDLGEIRQKSGKAVRAWAFEGDFDPAALKSNTLPLQWPPKSGKYIIVPEVDCAGWFSAEEAKKKINPAQVELLERLIEHFRQKTERLNR